MPQRSHFVDLTQVSRAALLTRGSFRITRVLGCRVKRSSEGEKKRKINRAVQQVSHSQSSTITLETFFVFKRSFSARFDDRKNLPKISKNRKLLFFFEQSQGREFFFGI